VGLGLRRFRFLVDKKCGILELDNIQVVNLVSRTADKIRFLREQAIRASPPFRLDSLLIRVARDRSLTTPDKVYYTSAIPAGDGASAPRHYRWIPFSYMMVVDDLGDSSKDIKEFNPTSIKILTSGTVFSWKDPTSQFGAVESSNGIVATQHPSTSSNKSRSWLGSKRKKELYEQAVLEHTVEYHFIAGNPEDVALFERVEVQGNLDHEDSQDRFPSLSLPEIIGLIKSGAISRKLLFCHLASLRNIEQ
jgi:hypothetical protein